MSAKDSNKRRINPILRLQSRLEHEENKRSGADMFLAKLFSSIAWSHGLTEKQNGQWKWFNLLNQYIHKLERIRFNQFKQQGAAGDSKLDAPSKNSVRGNIQKQLASPRMTWNVFCSAMRFLQIAKLEITVKAYTWNGKSTEHTQVINFSMDNEETFLSDVAKAKDPLPEDDVAKDNEAD